MVKRKFVMIVSVLVLFGLALYYYSSIAEIYYRSTGNILPLNATKNDLFQGRLFLLHEGYFNNRAI